VNIVTAISVILSGRLSKNLGLVRTMVYTHLFSNVMLFLVPVFHSLVISELFLYLRQTTSQMDVPPRDSLINTKIPKDARVASNSILLGVRNGMQIPGPGLAGLLFEVFPEGVFFSAALIKIAYDVAFFARYRTYRV
jgi:MFS family permease